jgi:hypothetical protein
MEETMSPAPTAAQASDERKTGILTWISARGDYGFLMTGLGQRRFFIHSSDVPPKAWVEGAHIEFTPAPPNPGTSNWRAKRTRVIRVPDARRREVAS